ncbi:MAG: hypothetical protein AAF733_10800, partial [Verrucomicrobiota bacterium]
AKTEQVIEPEKREVTLKREPEKPNSGPKISDKPISPVATRTESVGDGEQDSAAYFKAQLAEQLGGEVVAEVRHLALSDDEARMVAAITWKDGRQPPLVEIFFERDEFGRYLSTEDAPLEAPITLWAE